MAADVLVKFGGEYGELRETVEKSKAAIGDIETAINTVTSAFKKHGEQSESTFDKVASGVNKVTLGIGGAVVAVSAYLTGLGLVASSFGESIRSAAGAFDQSTVSIGGVEAVADRSGLALTDLGKSFADLQKKAREGDDEVTKALKVIGISASDAANMSQDALAVRMAQAFATAKDSANKAQAAVALFGSTAAEKLVPELDRGADHIRELQAAADRAGVVLGPQMTEKIRGTTAGFQAFGDKVLEIKEAVRGSSLQMYTQAKPAIDGLSKVYTDVAGNIAGLIESFNDLAGAGRRSGDAVGIIGQASSAFAKGIVYATAYVEEFAVKAVQSLSYVGVSLKGLGDVVTALGKDIAAMATTSSHALYTAFNEAISGVIQGFKNLGAAAKAALSLDMSGVSAAFSKLGADAETVGARIRTALGPNLLSNTSEAWTKMKDGAVASAKSLDSVIAKLEAQKKAQLELIDAGGIKGAPVQQTRTIADPSVAEGRSSSDNDRIQEALKTAQGEVQAAKDAETQKKELLDAGVQLNLMSEQAKVAATQDALQDRLQDEKAAYEKMLQIEGLKPQQHQEILNKMRAAEEDYNQDVLRIQIEAAKQTQRQWDEVTSSISSAFGSQVEGLLTQTTKLRDAFRQVLVSMIGDAIKFCITWSLRHAETIAENILGINQVVGAQIAGETAKTGAVEAGAATRVATEIGAAAASAAAMIGNVLKSIAALAAQAFAGVAAFMSSFIGPAALGVAGGVQAAVLAVGSVLPAFEAGAWELPRDMIAQVHQGEMIVPAAQASALRAAVPGGAVSNIGDAVANARLAMPPMGSYALQVPGRMAPNAPGSGIAAAMAASGGGDTHYHNWSFKIDGARGKNEIVAEIKRNVSDIAPIFARNARRNPSLRR